MHVTVVAATGGIGRHVVDQALAAGHTVTAAVRDPIKLHRRVAVAQVDLADPDPAALAAAVDGADAVVSCLGPRSSGDAGIVAAGTAVLIAAMRDSGCRRIVAVSGAGVSTVATPDRPDPPPREPGAGVFNRYLATPFARRLLGRHFVDVAMMESALRTSGLDWTAVRPPYLTDGPLTGRYRTEPGRNVRRGLRLSRADVAHLVLDVLGRPATVGLAIAAAY